MNINDAMAEAEEASRAIPVRDEPTDQPPTLPDTSSWVRRAPGDVIEAGTPYVRVRSFQTSFVPGALFAFTVTDLADHEVWTPPPAPSEPWSVISTDRDKPTLVRVTFDYGETGETITDFWWRTGDKGLIAGHHGVYETTHITSVELLHTHSPETHVPVERTLIDEVIRALVWLDDVRSPGSRDIDFRDVRGIVIDLASLASDESSDTDGGRS